MAKKKIPLHLKIVIGLLAGLAVGLLFSYLGVPKEFTLNYIKPIGTIFVNSLKMIAAPLVLASLIIGIANLGDVSKLSRMGGKTIGIYILTTVISITIGLAVVNLIEPGKFISTQTRMDLLEMYAGKVAAKADQAKELRESGPLQPLVNMVPTNIVQAASDNGSMLKIVFFAVLMGIALLKIPKEKGEGVVKFFDGINEIILKIIDFIMRIAPFGVFALITTMIVELAGDDPSSALEILGALLAYSLTVLLGLGIMIMLVYPMFLKIFTSFNYFDFFRGIRPAQLLAFSTSSSSATLPVTMECVEKKLKVSEEVSSFVLPLGATINMDGTSLYQGVAAVFIAQALGLDLTITQQIMIVLTATLASIGSAGVPGAGMVMLVIVLESVNIPAAGLALIIAPDRILDMCRTVVNVTGDATVSMAVASTEGQDFSEIDTEELVQE
ncbi:dicarboxylate/amino acid:cation symporter [Aureibacter tunicatorum]|uniref:Na+/H+-dicarboxylate symporter n=1 Tax=Aureibacter tunicatorum TaxID=866807 RepID=A0AAE4BSB2_9BACT|nr:dicarboxylate/amino acid:cation symporter [Aureibacter tunicatorum]MDR6238690.1 Na+/H+-dicarboxylate symporter [Aureibacter tunicatorum]BDD05379.1 glutamate:proton symporter [Aureibacter tunicatorum]